MKYSHVISDFTWSYSRITSFEMCPYQWFLRYIRHVPGGRQFFSDYGKLIHKIIELCLTGELPTEAAAGYYLSNFRKEVRGSAPKPEIFKTYFEQGFKYLQQFEFPYPDPIGVERKVDFAVDGIRFTGVIDCIAEDQGSIVVLDNKSRALKPRSARAKPTKSDQELDDYFRQLYLYSIPIKDMYHTYPDRLEFNCFRTGQLISEPFREEALEETKRWAVRTIEQITENEDWSPKLEYWKCRHLCGFNSQCEYFRMNYA